MHMQYHALINSYQSISIISLSLSLICFAMVAPHHMPAKSDHFWLTVHEVSLVMAAMVARVSLEDEVTIAFSVTDLAGIFV